MDFACGLIEDHSRKLRAFSNDALSISNDIPPTIKSPKKTTYDGSTLRRSLDKTTSHSRRRHTQALAMSSNITNQDATATPEPVVTALVSLLGRGGFASDSPPPPLDQRGKTRSPTQSENPFMRSSGTNNALDVYYRTVHADRQRQSILRQGGVTWQHHSSNAIPQQQQIPQSTPYLFANATDLQCYQSSTTTFQRSNLSSSSSSAGNPKPPFFPHTTAAAYPTQIQRGGAGGAPQMYSIPYSRPPATYTPPPQPRLPPKCNFGRSMSSSHEMLLPDSFSHSFLDRQPPPQQQQQQQTTLQQQQQQQFGTTAFVQLPKSNPVRKAELRAGSVMRDPGTVPETLPSVGSSHVAPPVATYDNVTFTPTISSTLGRTKAPPRKKQHPEGSDLHLAGVSALLEMSNNRQSKPVLHSGPSPLTSTVDESTIGNLKPAENLQHVESRFELLQHLGELLRKLERRMNSQRRSVSHMEDSLTKVSSITSTMKEKEDLLLERHRRAVEECNNIGTRLRKFKETGLQDYSVQELEELADVLTRSVISAGANLRSPTEIPPPSTEVESQGSENGSAVSYPSVDSVNSIVDSLGSPLPVADFMDTADEMIAILEKLKSAYNASRDHQTNLLRQLYKEKITARALVNSCDRLTEETTSARAASQKMSAELTQIETGNVAGSMNEDDRTIALQELEATLLKYLKDVNKLLAMKELSSSVALPTGKPPAPLQPL